MYKLIAISSPELSDLMAALARSYAQWRRAPGFQNALLMHPCSFDLHTVEARGGGGVNLWSRLVLLEALGLRGGFGQFSPLFDHSRHLKSGVLPWE